MSIDTRITIGTLPEPAVLARLHGLQEIFTDLHMSVGQIHDHITASLSTVKRHITQQHGIHTELYCHLHMMCHKD